MGLAIFIGLLEVLFVENIYLRTIYKKYKSICKDLIGMVKATILAILYSLPNHTYQMKLEHKLNRTLFIFMLYKEIYFIIYWLKIILSKDGNNLFLFP